MRCVRRRYARKHCRYGPPRVAGLGGHPADIEQNLLTQCQHRCDNAFESLLSGLQVPTINGATFCQRQCHCRACLLNVLHAEASWDAHKWKFLNVLGWAWGTVAAAVLVCDFRACGTSCMRHVYEKNGSLGVPHEAWMSMKA